MATRDDLAAPRGLSVECDELIAENKHIIRAHVYDVLFGTAFADRITTTEMIADKAAKYEEVFGDAAGTYQDCDRRGKLQEQLN